MNYWIVWPVGIVLWILIGWAEFAYLEWHAIRDQKPNEPTLSYFVYCVTAKFPLSIAVGCTLIGMFFGILYTHFWWHWCPPGSISAG